MALAFRWRRWSWRRRGRNGGGSPAVALGEGAPVMQASLPAAAPAWPNAGLTRARYAMLSLYRFGTRWCTGDGPCCWRFRLIPPVLVRFAEQRRRRGAAGDGVAR